MAKILTESKREKEAAGHWARAIQLDQGSSASYVAKAYSLRSIGQFDEALATFKQAIAATPRRPDPYIGYVSAKRIDESDRPILTQMQEILDLCGLSPVDQIGLHFALGKGFDNLGEYESAISHFDEANLLKLTKTDQVPRFDVDAFKQETDDKIRTITGQLFEQFREASNLSETPVFVLGMMRSGTTLVEQILSCHPSIGGAGEQPFWREWEPQAVNWQSSHVDGVRLAELSRQFCALLEKAAPNKARVIDKNPANVMIAGLLHLAYPNARIIHTLRSPVDTALSIWMTPVQTVAPFVSDRANIVAAYKEYQRLSNHWRSILPSDRYMEIRYEALVANREAETRRVVEFLGVEWSDACLHPEENLRTIRTPSAWQARQPVYATSIDKWKQYEPWLGVFSELL